MVQPRRAFPWLFLCILTCLFVLSTASPRLWERASRQPDKPDLVRTTSHHVPLGAEDPLPPAPPEYGEAETDGENRVEMLASRPTPTHPVEGEGTEWQLAQEEIAEPLPLPIDTPQEVEAVTPAIIEVAMPIEPAAKFGAQATEPQEAIGEPENGPAETLPEPTQREPVIVANIPSPVQVVPQDDVRPLEEAFDPDANQPHALSKMSLPNRERAELNADDSWREPETLLESLNSLAASGAASKWAKNVIRDIRALGPAVSGGSDEATTILEQLAQLNRLAPRLAESIPDRNLARKLSKTNFSLGRRLAVWQGVVGLGVPQSTSSVASEVDPERLALCLADVDAITGDSAEGKAWRSYLMVDALKELSQHESPSTEAITRQLAQQALERLTQTALTPHQQKFVTSGPVAALRMELRRWAAEPIGAATVLRDIETYERTGLPSDARRLAVDGQHLIVSSVDARRQLAERVDRHYRNGNVRIAITEELLNKLIPERDLEYAQVNDRVLGRLVYGESLMASDLAIRMLPDPHRVRLALEVTGKITAATTAEAGPARFHNDSDSSYIARKPLEIDMKGISVWPVEVDVENESRITGVETPLDPIPLLGSGAKWLARSQAEQSQPAAKREVKQKVAAQARERINSETKQRLTEVVARLNERVFDPLNSLSLDPQMIAAETTDKRFTMRLRLAGEDQLGSHTPRPQAPGDSLASVQIHESVLNNGIQRLGLNGRTFSLPELSQHIAARLNRPTAWEIDPEHADVKITFAEKDSIVVRCQDGQVVLTLSIAQLSKATRKWKNFQIRAFYKPEVNGREAQLVRDGVIHLIGQRLSTGAQIALRGIFSRALSKNNPWGLMPEQIVNEPKLDYAAVTQFVIDDGWIGISLGPKTSVGFTARRPKTAVR